MNARELIGQRILIKSERQFGKDGIEEVRITEVSPSGQWLKLMNTHGAKYWRAMTTVSLIEVLTDLSAEPKPIGM